MDEWCCLASAIRYIRSATVLRSVTDHYSTVAVTYVFPDSDKGERAGGGLIHVIEQEMEKRKCGY